MHFIKALAVGVSAIVILAAAVVSANDDVEIRFTCDDNGQLTRYQYGNDVKFSLAGVTPSESQKLKAESGSEEGFPYSYPYGGYTRRQIGPSGTNEMSKEQFRRVAALAVAGGVDPFLALSILITEQTPFLKNESVTEGYFAIYGAFPIDGWPAASYLKCSIEKNEFPALRRDHPVIRENLSKLEEIKKEYLRATDGLNSRYNRLANDIETLETQANMSASVNEQRERLLRAKKNELGELRKKDEAALAVVNSRLPSVTGKFERDLMLQYVTCGRECVAIVDGQCKAEPCGVDKYPIFDFSSLGSETRTSTFCSHQSVILNGNHFEATERAPTVGDCCFQVKMPALSTRDQRQMMALGALGLRVFWDDKITKALKQVKRGNERVSGINGEHAHRLARIAQRWNGWGKMGVTEKINSCLSGLDMSQRPVIGGKAMDLMINSTLTNPYLTKLILELSKAQGKPVKSLLCEYAGPGEKTMRSKAFHDKINREYLSSSNCQ